MNSANLIQAVRGPILLITLGVLMVVDYAGQFSFGRTWPVLIIVFGLLKLLERVVAPPPPPPQYAGPPAPPPYGAGGNVP